ncbi:Hypothetical protein CINCED_3A005018 [Cinara cedri]|uniref:DDE-1 domain-containing protein n=1 Tax=Cinara cedri TaxID=506608 RepID=A0A5E4MZ23_9HEMI|nr:Hypothetical protein CINCED_3A005018 [Cinara cedri]
MQDQRKNGENVLFCSYRDILNDPRRFFNCDETGLQTCPESGRIFGPNALKDFYDIASGNEKECVTVLCTYSADGGGTLPMVFYPYKRISTSIMTSFPGKWLIGRLDTS